jgi:hypothetical protein
VHACKQAFSSTRSPSNGECIFCALVLPPRFDSFANHPGFPAFHRNPTEKLHIAETHWAATSLRHPHVHRPSRSSLSPLSAAFCRHGRPRRVRWTATRFYCGARASVVMAFLSASNKRAAAASLECTPAQNSSSLHRRWSSRLFDEMGKRDCFVSVFSAPEP